MNAHMKEVHSEDFLKGEKNYIKLKNSNKYKHVAKLFLVPSNEKAIIIDKIFHGEFNSPQTIDTPLGQKIDVEKSS